MPTDASIQQPEPDAALTTQAQLSLERAPYQVRKWIDIPNVKAYRGTVPATDAHTRELNPIAGVETGDTGAVQIYRPDQFQGKDARDHTDQIIGHEGVHMVQNQMPESMTSQFPPIDPRDPYADLRLTTTQLAQMRAGGDTLWKHSVEGQASIVQSYIARHEWLNSQATPQQKQDYLNSAGDYEGAGNAQFEGAYQPYLNDLGSLDLKNREPMPDATVSSSALLPGYAMFTVSGDPADEGEAPTPANKNGAVAIPSNDAAVAQSIDAYTQQELQKQNSSLQANLAKASETDPNLAAEAQQLGFQTGVGPDVASRNMALVRKMALVQNAGAANLPQTAPRLAKLLQDPNFSGVAYDDLGNLSRIEQGAATVRSLTPMESFKYNFEDPANKALMQYPLTRMLSETVGASAKMAGDVGSFFGWHGTGPSKQNWLQRQAQADMPETYGLEHTGLDTLAENVGPMIPAMLASGGISGIAKALQVSENAAKVLAAVGVGGMFSASQGGETYTQMAAAGKSDAAARRAALESAGITALPNMAMGMTDFVPALERNPLLASLGIGGATGAAGQLAQNVATGQQPWYRGLGKGAVQGAAVMGGMHVGFGAFQSEMGDITDVVEASKLRTRSPQVFQAGVNAMFEGDPSVRIPAQEFVDYFHGKNLDPAAAANQLGVSNLAEAAAAGSDLEIPKENFFGKLDPEHQKGLLPDVVDPNMEMTGRQAEAAKQELQDWIDNGGAAKLQAEYEQADAETQATPEWQSVHADLKQRYLDAGEKENAADSYATLQANAIANLAKQSGMKADELLALHNPKIVAADAPETATTPVRYQAAIDSIRSVVEAAKQPGHAPQKAVIAPVEPWLVSTAKENGLDVDGYQHVVDGSAIRHVINRHGNEAAEAKAGQIAVTESDFEKIPEVLTEPDRVIFGTKNKGGRDQIGYAKTMPDGSTLYIEEARRGRKELAAVSMRKFPATMDADSVAASLHLDARDDGIAPIVVRHPSADKAEISGESGDVLHQASAAEQPRGWFRMTPEGGYEIGKTKIGDMSTLIHEPAHAYLELFRDLSGREKASAGLQDDFKKITAWLGTTPEEARANGFTREQHEQWARANEQYVREGKAPSAGLRRAFHNFAVWLGSIYQRATDLNVEVSPEIRGVMDRLYASESAVDHAERQTGEPLFKSPEEAGWTEEQFRNYADAHGMAVDKAREQVSAEMNAAAERERTQTFREERGNVRDAVTEQLDSRPEYTAIRSLRRGKLDDGTELTLSREALAQQFGEERVKALNKLHPGLYRQAGGVDADTAAELFGFHSGEEMLRGLEAAPRRTAAIEAATRDHLVNKYGDVRYDGTLNDRARFAIENDERAGNLYRELRALKTRLASVEKKAADTKAAMAGITLEPLEHYQAAARSMIESKAIADIQPYRYLNASRKFSRDAFEAAGKGDARRAFEAKNKELLNHFLFRAAAEAHEYADKFESYAKRMQSRGVQQRMGLAGSDTRDQFNGLLARYKLGGGPPPERSLRDWADEMYGDTYEPAISPAMLDGTEVKDYRSVPLSEVRELHEALQNIRHLAQMQYKVYIDGKMEDFGERRTALVNTAREKLPSKPVPVLEKETRLGRLLRSIQGVAVGSTRMEFLINKLDGGTRGPWHDIIWNPYENAKGDEEALQHKFTKSVNDHVEAETARQGLRLLDKVMVDGIPSSETVTRKDLVSMALNMGNQGNLDRLRKSFEFHGWDPEAIPKIAGMLTREEWGFVQNIWDSLKPYGERMAELEKRQTGLPPKMVKVEPFTVHFDDGTEKNLAGGYYPIKIDPKYSLKGYEEDTSKAARNLMETGYGRATTSRGYTKERTGFGGPLMLDYERVLSEHIAKVTKDLSHREWMQTTNKMFTDLQVRQTLRETLGPQYEKDFMPFLRAAVNDRNGSLDRGDNDIRPLIETLRSNLINASLGFKASTSLLQLTHLPRIMLFTRPGSFTQAMVDFWKDPAATTATIRELSPNEMRFRGENLDRDYKSALEEVAKKKGASAAAKRFGLASLQYADHAISFPLWLSVYRDALAKNTELPDSRAHELAMHDADAAVRMGVGSGTTGDLPPVMRRNDWGSRLETMLYGFHNLNYNILRYKVGSTAASEYRAGNVAGAAGKLTAGMTLAWLLPALVSSYVTGNGPKDGENIGAWAAKRSLFFAAGTLPLLKDIGSMVEYGSLNPMVNVLKRAVTTGEKTFADKADKDWTGLGIDWMELGGDMTGVPGTNQAAQTARYVHRATQGKIENPTIMGAVVGGAHK